MPNKKSTKSPVASRPFRVRQSAIHGRGVFAAKKIRKGARLVEYKGQRITWEEAERRYPKDPIPYHTFLFEIGDGSQCLDAVRRGSPAKWINHSCKPNCEAEEDEDERVFIVAIRDRQTLQVRGQVGARRVNATLEIGGSDVCGHVFEREQ